MLHQRRYFSWARLPGQSLSRTCLQYTMWILAASCSRQFQSICDMLYNETRQMLEVLDTRDSDIDGLEIEQVQAWILLVLYEVTRSHSRRGWISAGRAFRLVQLMRLFEIDGTGGILSSSTTEDWVMLEEKRRTFWMAYLLDRFISVQNGLPLTLNEQVVCLQFTASGILGLYTNSCLYRFSLACLPVIPSSKVCSVYKWVFSPRKSPQHPPQLCRLLLNALYLPRSAGERYCINTVPPLSMSTAIHLRISGTDIIGLITYLPRGSQC